MNHPSLFAPAARVSDPDTSHVAARSVTPGRTEARILAAFRSATVVELGATDDELCGRLDDLWGPTVKSARSRLSGVGMLCDTGRRRVSGRGRKQIVWALKEETTP